MYNLYLVSNLAVWLQQINKLCLLTDRTASATSVQPGTRIISARPYQVRFSYSYVAVGNISTCTERRAVPLRYISFLLKSTRRKNPAVDRSWQWVSGSRVMSQMGQHVDGLRGLRNPSMCWPIRLMTHDPLTRWQVSSTARFLRRQYLWPIDPWSINWWLNQSTELLVLDL